MKKSTRPSDKSSATGTADGGGRSSTQTRGELLDAAEELFLELGIDATSLRAITSRAGANLAAVSYHFGGKEGLVRAVFDRRLRPVNEERLRRLTELEGEHSPAPPPPEGVIRAFLEPVIRFGQEPSAEPMRFRRLMGRSFAEPGEQMRLRLREQFREVGERFLSALGRCFPHLPPNVVLWRFHFMLGSLVHVALHGKLMAEHSGGACDPARAEDVADRLVEFILGGFAAPVKGAVSEEPGDRSPRSGDDDESAPAIFAWEEGF